jgi:type IV pilus assembly protein PilM
MPRQHRANTCPRRVGLDIGSHTLKAVEVVERGPEIVVRAAGAVALPVTEGSHQPPDHSTTVHAIRALWSAARFQSGKVILALPPEALYIKWLHLEASDREALDMTARTAAVRGAPFPPDDAIVDYRVLASRGTLSSNVYFVMLVAASSTAVDSLLNAAEAAGLEPVAVDVGSTAVLRCLDTRRRAAGFLWSGQPIAHCIVGARNTTIAVVRSGEMEFARTVPVGGNDFTECVADHLAVSWSEAEKIKGTPGNRLVAGGSLIASHGNEEVRVPCENVVGRLAREIQRSLRFFASQFAEGSYLGMIGGMTLSGGGALMKGLDTCLEEQGIDVAGVINPFAGLSVDGEAGLQQIGDTAAQYSVAMGLALGDYWSSGVGRAAEAELAA